MSKQRTQRKPDTGYPLLDWMIEHELGTSTLVHCQLVCEWAGSDMCCPGANLGISMQTIEVVVFQPKCLQLLTRIPRRQRVRKVRQHVAQIPGKIPPDAGTRV